MGSLLSLVAIGVALLAGKLAARVGEIHTAVRAQQLARAMSIQAACLAWFAAGGIYGLGLLLSLS